VSGGTEVSVEERDDPPSSTLSRWLVIASADQPVTAKTGVLAALWSCKERMASASALLHVVRDAIDDEGVRQLLGCALKRPIPRPKAAHDRTRPASRLSASFGTEP